MNNIDFTPFLWFLGVLKTLHWSAKTHAHHVVLGEAYEQFDEKIDEFVENYLGSFPQVQFSVGNMTPDAPGAQDGIQGFQDAFNKFIDCVNHYACQNAGLQSLRDDLQSIGNRTYYLLKMQ